jgi:hypothetical protein
VYGENNGPKIAAKKISIIATRLTIETLLPLSLRQTSCQYVRLGRIDSVFISTFLLSGLKSSLENCMAHLLFSKFDSWVDQNIYDIYQKVHQDYKACVEYRNSHHRSVIPV